MVDVEGVRECPLRTPNSHIRKNLHSSRLDRMDAVLKHFKKVAVQQGWITNPDVKCPICGHDFYSLSCPHKLEEVKGASA